MRIQPLHENGHGLGTGLDVCRGRGDVGDAPVGPVVAADGGEAGRVVEVLDAGFDPFAGGAGGGTGEEEEDAGLVELVGVCCCEGEACGAEFWKGVLGEGFVGGCFVFVG